MNPNPFVMFPIALVDLALLGEVVRRRKGVLSSSTI